LRSLFILVLSGSVRAVLRRRGLVQSKSLQTSTWGRTVLGPLANLPHVPWRHRWPHCSLLPGQPFRRREESVPSPLANAVGRNGQGGGTHHTIPCLSQFPNLKLYTMFNKKYSHLLILLHSLGLKEKYLNYLVIRNTFSL